MRRTGLLALLLSACAAPSSPADGGVPIDPPVLRDGGRDAPAPPDTGVAAPPIRGVFGAPCVDGTCVDGSSCGGAWVMVEALDGTVREIDLSAGTCTRRCDPAEPAPCGLGFCETEAPLGLGSASLLDEAGRGVCGFGCLAAWEPLSPDAGDRTCVAPPPACERDADCLYERVSDEPPLFRELAPGEAVCRDGACRRASGSSPG